MTDLETRLRDMGDDFRLDRPVDAIIARGTILRRRRRISQVVAAAIAPVMAGLTADGTGSTVASGAPPMVRLSPAELEAADESCRSLGPTSARGMTNAFAADKYGNDTVVLYRSPGETTNYGTCAVTDGGVGWGGGPGALQVPTQARPISPDRAQVIDSTEEGSGVLLDVGLVGPSVARVVADIGGESIQASISDGWFWFATGFEHTPHDDSTPGIQLRAYDADGVVVDETHLARLGLHHGSGDGKVGRSPMAV